MVRTDLMPRTTRGTGHAHAKAILIGEHTVVYGLPAIAVPLPDLSVHASAYWANKTAPQDNSPGSSATPDDPIDEFDYRFSGSEIAESRSGAAIAVGEALLRWGYADTAVYGSVHGNFPAARGLGASAAGAAAAVRAVADLCGRNLDDRTLYELIQCGERRTHGRASGVDAATVLSHRPIRFQAGVTSPIAIGLDATLVVGDSGAAGSTWRAVNVVKGILQQADGTAHRLLDRAASCIDAATIDLTEGRARELGARLNEFHDVLTELGVSTPAIDDLVTAARRTGALGAKLTGGGLGGCVLALATDADAAAVAGAMRSAGAVRTWIVSTRSWSS